MWTQIQFSIWQILEIKKNEGNQDATDHNVECHESCEYFVNEKIFEKKFLNSKCMGYFVMGKEFLYL